MQDTLTGLSGRRLSLTRYSTFILFIYGLSLLTVNKAYNVVPILLALPALYLLLHKKLSFVADLKLLFATFVLFLTPILISILLGYSSLSYLDRPVRSIFMLLVGALLIKLRPRQSVFFTGLALGVCVALVLVLIQLSNGDLRPSLWANPIPYSEVAAAIFALLIAAWGWPNGPGKWLALLGQVCCLAIVLVSQTRGSLLSLLAVILFVALFCLSRNMVRRRLVLAGGLLLVLVVALILGQTSVGSRFGTMVSNLNNYRPGEKFNSTGIRLELWKESLLLAGERPLTGYGNLAHRERAKVLIAQGKIEAFVVDWPHFHSDYFEALATRGIPGLLSVMVLYLSPFMLFFKYRKSSPFLSLAAMAAVISYMVSSLTDVPLKNGLTSMFFFMSVVVMTAFLNIPHPSDVENSETVQA